MRIPTMRGLIDRRILANFRIDAELMASHLPPPFRPKLVNGFAIGGICLIRLKAIRPKFFPLPWGLGSENAAHRIAVEWEENGRSFEGVYIPRRDSSSRLNAMVGGRIFPGVHHHASFEVKESDSRFDVAFQSADRTARVRVAGSIADCLPDTSLFRSINEASDFFRAGSLGYSVSKIAGQYDGLELQCDGWQVTPLKVELIESSYFDNERDFPLGSVNFDCALLMRGVDHEWHAREELCCAAGS